MKKLITLFFIIGIVSFQSYSFAQTHLNIDYNHIKEYVTSNSSDFENLLQRFKDNDSLLNQQDYAMIYYGYSFTPNYNGSMDNFEELDALIKEQKNEEAYEWGTQFLEKNPVSLKMILCMFSLSEKLKKDDSIKKVYIKKFSKLLGMISHTGDGESEETAFKVICVDDEYQLLYLFFQVENLKSQALVNNCDVIEFEKSKYFKGGTKMYFDISRSLDHLRNRFRNNSSN